MSVSTTLRDSLDGQGIRIFQSPGFASGWIAEARIKKIIAKSVHNTDDPVLMTSGLSETPFDALVQLSRACSDELQKFERWRASLVHSVDDNDEEP